MSVFGRLKGIHLSGSTSVGTVARALAIVTGVTLVYKALKCATRLYTDAVSGHSLRSEVTRLRASIDERNLKIVEFEQNIRRRTQPFHYLCEDLMVEILEWLYMEELCALLPTSPSFRSHVTNALRQRKFVLPNVRHQKWGKSSTVLYEDRKHYRTNFDGRDERKWSSEYAAAIAWHCPNVEVVESGYHAKERFLLGRSDRLHFKPFFREDVVFLVNICSKITHIDGIIGLRASELEQIKVDSIAIKALSITIDLQWSTRIEIIRSFLSKCVKLEYLELVDGSNEVDDENISVANLLESVLPESLRGVHSLKLSHFALGASDVDSVMKSFPNLEALALDVKLGLQLFLRSFLSARQNALGILDLTVQEHRDLKNLLKMSDTMYSREVVIKVLDESLLWTSKDEECTRAFRFPPHTRQLTLVFQKSDLGDYNASREWRPFCPKCGLRSSDADEAMIDNFELNHPEQLLSRYGFEARRQCGESACKDIGYALKKSAPGVETLLVAVADSASLPKFGLHEQFSPGIEKRALNILRGTNILSGLAKEKPIPKKRRTVWDELQEMKEEMERRRAEAEALVSSDSDGDSDDSDSDEESDGASDSDSNEDSDGDSDVDGIDPNEESDGA